MANIYYLGEHAPSAPTVRGRNEGTLVASEAILLYHVYWGRNAWNSTWISQYSPNTLLNSHADARKFVDRRKTQGSVFGLIVLPGWHLDFGKVRYVVTEINTKHPFSKLTDSKFLNVGQLETSCLSYLSPTSEVWLRGQRLSNGVIVQQTDLSIPDYVKWGDRTKFPGQQQTVGQYKRVVSLKQWYFSPVREGGSFEIETKFFEAHLGGRAA